MIVSDLTTDLDQHLRSLALRIGTVEAEANRSVTVEALNLKRAWVAEATGHKNLPHLPASVVVDNLPEGAKRISFGDGNQGTIAHIGTFGAPKTAPFMNPFQHVPPAARLLAEFLGRIGVAL